MRREPSTGCGGGCRADWTPAHRGSAGQLVRFFPNKRSWWELFDTVTLEIERSDPLTNQIKHFAAVIRGEVDPLVSGRDGLKTLLVTDAVTEAARTGQIIKIGP